jgi:hypothetical protein
MKALKAGKLVTAILRGFGEMRPWQMQMHGKKGMEKGYDAKKMEWEAVALRAFDRAAGVPGHGRRY